jgi:hypothetical protein
MTPRERSDRAKQLLADPTFRVVMKDIREGLVRQLESTAIDDATTHHEIALTLQLLARIPVNLQKYATDLEVDEHRQRQDSWMKRMRQQLTP